ncbi:MAG: hypothetical protein N5P05_003370 [Chroococcopsis gigantea SAG 12.99]|jgi:ABC-type transporter Mla subunit MlaD|nr:hypothetical protein [Chlorogloea purpurea SAG 13.99]MDV3001764.1 hypothetical protein [Chroococcopsis gigantea SAG 12.99]
MIICKRFLLFLSLGLFLVYGCLINPAPALATHWQDTLNQGLGGLIQSVTQEYIEETEGVFNGTLKELKTTISQLRSLLQQIADPEISPEVRQELLREIEADQESLKASADVFKDLQSGAGNFQSYMEESLRGFVAGLDGKFIDSSGAFEEMSDLISSLAQDAGKVTDTEITALVSQVSEGVRQLNRSIESTNNLLKSFNQ